jgi:hypothetical protein
VLLVQFQKRLVCIKTGYALPGTYTVKFEKIGFPIVTRTVTLATNVLTTLDITILQPNEFTLTVTSKDAVTNTPIGNVKFIISKPGSNTALTTNTNGEFSQSCFNNGGTFDIVAGKWGYKTKSYNGVSLVNGSPPFVITLEKGYEDPFAIDLGWELEGGSCTYIQGAWARSIPDNITTGGTQLTPMADNPVDIGNLCYITGFGLESPDVNDLDLCTTYLKSPNMDLSAMQDPHIKFDYWFQSLAANGAAPDDKFWVLLDNGTDVDSVFTVTTPSGAWQLGQDIRVRDFMVPTATMVCYFCAIDRGVPHWVEAAVDAFSVYNLVNTNDTPEFNANFITQPNPFAESTTIRYHLENNTPALLNIYNILGQIQTSIALPNNEGSISIGADLPKGIYELQIEQNGQRTKVQKIVKM